MYNLDTKKIASLSPQGLKDYIAQCETGFNDDMDELVKTLSTRQTLRLCGLAGPSCSGKTTASFKITSKLSELGIGVRTISIDDFFLSNNQGPVGEDGLPDYESLNYVDMDLLQSTLYDIMKGKEVLLPKFDFPTGRRIDGHERFKPGPNEIVILEGLHALNDVMYENLPKTQCYRVFINVLGTLSADGEPLFTGQELRLMRRLIRDYKFRAADAQLTFKLWDNVIKGEIKNINPFENRADFKLNSMFEYEPCAVKEQVVKVLSGLRPDSVFAPQAETLRKKLENLPYIGREYVPEDSLMQEFVGGEIQ